MLQLVQRMEGKREGRLYIGKHNLKMESYLSYAVLSDYNEGKGWLRETNHYFIIYFINIASNLL